MKMNNPAMGFSCLLFFISCMLINISLALGALCYDTGNFTANSTYEKNRNLMLSSLASNVTLRDGLFYTATIGQEPDKVYGLVLCRGDASSDKCARSVSIAISSIMGACQYQKEAVAWGADHPCILHYANHSIFGKMEMKPMAYGCDGTDVARNMSQFDQTWESLMDHLVRKASTGSYYSRRKFATGEANLTAFVNIYALMQCTPDISQSDCDFCLRQSVATSESECYGKTGLFMKPSCMYMWDINPFYETVPDAPSLSPSPPPQSSNSTIITDSGFVYAVKGGIASGIVIIIVVSVVLLISLVALGLVFRQRRKTRKNKKIRSQLETEDANEIDTAAESLQFNFSTIRSATNDFSIDNKLGQGGFGVVYKGRLPDGQNIAVKRLSRESAQGELEFKNEVLLVARLQHRNLVRLLGFCLEGNERLLIYEFVPNSSLDSFIFDPIKCLLLDWKTRYKIISGIARGLLYLHEDSRLRVIHRDLKASNILLDDVMTPKISDFGMAKLFEIDQTQDNTARIVGTFGYMAPEYVRYGQFSVKSDVFSFGVLVLETISGQKNSCFYNEEESQDLLTYAWKNWKEGTALNVIDPILRAGSSSEMMRCIHIGLLCVQENVASRPTMASVVLMLTSCSVALAAPSKPAFSTHSSTQLDNSELSILDQSKYYVQFSLNEASITELNPR